MLNLKQFAPCVGIAILLAWGTASHSGDAPLAGVAPAAETSLQPAAKQQTHGDQAAAPEQSGHEGKSGNEEESRQAHVTKRLRGKVVWLDEAMQRLHEVEFDSDSRHVAVALETLSGELHPIIKEFRGRGFWKDQRLRNQPLELIVRRYRGSPMVQVIRVYTRHDSKLYEFDYWCDICAIPMFEVKDCECCQGPIRIRERLVGDSGKTLAQERNPPE